MVRHAAVVEYLKRELSVFRFHDHDHELAITREHVNVKQSQWVSTKVTLQFDELLHREYKKFKLQLLATAEGRLYIVIYHQIKSARLRLSRPTTRRDLFPRIVELLTQLAGKARKFDVDTVQITLVEPLVRYITASNDRLHLHLAQQKPLLAEPVPVLLKDNPTQDFQFQLV